MHILIVAQLDLSACPCFRLKACHCVVHSANEICELLVYSFFFLLSSYLSIHALQRSMQHDSSLAHTRRVSKW